LLRSIWLTPVWFAAGLSVLALTRPVRPPPAFDGCPEAPSTGEALPDEADQRGGFRDDVGPDVIAADLTSVVKWGTVGELTGYSIGTTSCNVGDEPLSWIADSSEHPVIAQNVHRLKDGRFEQIGLSWVKHGNCAQQRTACGECEEYCEERCCDHLGVGCSDPYTATENGTQRRMGPRSEINPFTGEFRWPHGGKDKTGDAIYKRIQVRNDDLDPSGNEGARYFGEAVYVAPDDATQGNGQNNASFRELRVGELHEGGYRLELIDATARTSPAIEAWASADPEVDLANVLIPGEGLFVLAARAYDRGDGTWSYEYALFNLNSDRAAQSFAVPLVRTVEVASTGFRDIAYHSGEPYSDADWSITQDSERIEWACETFEQNEDANALRWGTLYNFRFHANVPPARGSLEIGLFKSGDPQRVSADGVVPRPTGDANCDRSVDLDDIDAFVLALVDPAGFAERYPGCDPLNGDTDFSGTVDFDDIDRFVELLTGE
jgi:hypothetical protein